MSPTPAENGIHTPKELELMAKLKKLEEDRVTFVAMVRTKIEKIESERDAKNEENARLSEKVHELDMVIRDLSQFSGKGKNKSDDDDALMRAKELLFEKVKVQKKQELQIQALNNQIVANKDVLDITKDMLNLKNIENDHLQSQVESMKLRVKNEHERFLLTEKKLNISKQKELSLNSEYETQRNIFKDLKEIYESKIQILTKEIERLKQQQ